MKLSVVIPVYNGAEFIQKSYHSILNQQIEDFEILYVDNNSVDTSMEEIQKLEETDARVKLFIETKQGAAPARNLGITNAKGGYVYVFDVDDEIYPDALKKMIAVLDQNFTVDAVFGKMVKSHQGISKTQKPIDETDKVDIKEKPFWGMHWFSDLSIVVGPPAFLYRKTVFSKIGTYNEAIKNTEDTAFDIKLGMTCKIAFIDTYIYLYFKHASSTIEMAKKNEDLIAIHWTRFVKSHLPFYLENDVPLQYKTLLYKYLFSTIGKRIHATKGQQNRKHLKEQLLKEIKPIMPPLFIRFYLSMFVLFPFDYIKKFYVYYIVPYYMKNHIKKL